MLKLKSVRVGPPPATEPATGVRDTATKNTRKLMTATPGYVT
jgi:hypothetical protein